MDQSQRWEASVLPLHHHALELIGIPQILLLIIIPIPLLKVHSYKLSKITIKTNVLLI